MAQFTIPTIESGRLVFRAFRESTDFEPYARFYATDATKYYGGPLERALAWRAAATMVGHWALRGFGAWAVEEKATGDFCGMVGLWHPEGWPEREITWAIVPEKQGMGFAYEGALRARKFAHETLGWKDVYSCILEGNEPSIGLAQKLGATLDRKQHYSSRGTFLVYRHAQEDA